MNHITARLDPCRLAVMVDVTRAAEAVLDQVADAFRRDPDAMADLLQRLGDARAHAEYLHTGPIERPDCEVDEAGALVDRYREDLVDGIGDGNGLAPVEESLNEREACALADQLVAAADGTLACRLRGAA